jgi:histidinol-phosphate aminotransferase
MPLDAMTSCAVAPAPRIADREPYASPHPPLPIDLWLNSNEGLAPPPDLFDRIRGSLPDLVRRYPSVATLEERIAERLGQPRDCVLATAGADDAIYRACLTMLDRRREIILPVPTFEMIERYAHLAGGTVVEVDWLNGPYPIEAVLARISRRTAMIAVVSPNNPTGAVARIGDLRRLSAAAPHALLLVDLAYAEFADEDLTAAAAALPNALIVRTLSKAWGLAGLRVGYAIGSPIVVQWLRTVGNPFAVSGLSAALALERLETGGEVLRSFVERVRAERAELAEVLRATGAEPLPSQANFVLARFPNATATWHGLARRGIAVRAFPGHPLLEDYLRITCPGEPVSFARLSDALRQVGSQTR